MNLWLDDKRPPPEGWTLARTYVEAITLLHTGWVVRASLDYDLIPPDKGIDVVNWMIQNQIWPKEKPAIHSANPIGAARMAILIDRHGPY